MLFNRATSLLRAVRSILGASDFDCSLVVVWPSAGIFQTTSPPINAPTRKTTTLLNIGTPPAEIGCPKILCLRPHFNRIIRSAEELAKELWMSGRLKCLSLPKRLYYLGRLR